MQLQVNEKHEITGYAAVGGFAEGVEAEAWLWPYTGVKQYEQHERDAEDPLPGDRPAHGGGRAFGYPSGLPQTYPGGKESRLAGTGIRRTGEDGGWDAMAVGVQRA